MPVRLLSSSVLRWPDAKIVDQAVRCWATKVVQNRNEVKRIGYFGSYARGNWSVGSDLDLVIVVGSSRQPFWRRAVEWDTTNLPVPVDLLVYTEDEWQALSRQGKLFQTLQQEAVWVYLRESISVPE